jgi:hypothetical protein
MIPKVFYYYRYNYSETPFKLKMLSLILFPLIFISAALWRTCRGKSTPIYKNSHATIEGRITSLLSLMTLGDKMLQLSEGDIAFWMNSTGGSFNATA